MSMRRLRRGVCSATDVAAGLEEAGLELGQERGQGRSRVESFEGSDRPSEVQWCCGDYGVCGGGWRLLNGETGDELRVEC